MKKKWHLKKRYKIIIIILLILSFLTLWSRYISTAGLMIKEYRVVSNNLPISFDGLKVVQFTDVHYGRTINNKELKHLVDEVNALKPDLILFTGDLVDKDIKMTSKIKKDVTTILGNLKAKIGKYAVSGNHDLKFKEYNSIIQDSGFITINNSFDIIYSDTYDSIYIAGLESEVKGHPDIAKVTSYLEPPKEGEEKDIPKYKILLLHTPDTFTKVKEYNFDLVVAGHSHNGQIRLPFIGSIVTPEGAKKYYEPEYKIGKTSLFVSGGLGTSNANFRFFNKPSFNFYRLVTK